MPKPEGYPFLRIAKQFGLPYAGVLAAADECKRTGSITSFPGVRSWQHLTDACVEVAAATRVQEDVRSGRIDWQTGERVVDPIEPELPL